jgi:hypothetical protein
MKRIMVLHVLAFSFAINAYAQADSVKWEHEIEVISKSEKFGSEEHFAYSTFVYEATEDAVRKLIIDMVKASAKGKVSKKSTIEALEVDFPDIGEDPVDVKAVTSPVMARHAVKVSMAFFVNDQLINPSDFPDSDKAAKEAMYELSVMFNRSAIAAQIVEIENEMRIADIKYKEMQKEKDRYKKQIANGELKLAELDAHMVKLSAKLLDKQRKVEVAKILGESASADSKEAKKYAKAQQNVMKVEREIMKTQQSKLKVQQNMDLSKSALPLKIKEIEESEADMKKSNESLAKLHAKRDSIS